MSKFNIIFLIKMIKLAILLKYFYRIVIKDLEYENKITFKIMIKF